MNRLSMFLLNAFRNRSLIFTLAQNDLRQRYIGTAGGLTWALIQPLVLIATYWFVFSYGLKVGVISDVPFILYFVCGFAPWMMFSDSISQSTATIVDNSHLVKKVVFPTEILLIVHQIVHLKLHGIALMIIAVLLVAYQWPMTWYVLQLPYFTVCALVLGLGFGWLTSALNVFFRDIGQAVNICLGIWFWLTPIVWPLEILPPVLKQIMGLNPTYYIVQGYRDSLLIGAPIWSKPIEILKFWIIAIVILFIGAHIFRRLKRDFVEVL